MLSEQIWRYALLLIVFVAFLSTLSDARRHHRRRNARPEKRFLTGVAGKSVELRCDLPKATPPEVKWIDYVYNLSPEPEQIFSTAGNNRMQINTEHVNAANFRVDEDYSLTISALKIGESAGEYRCQSIVDGRTQQLAFDVTVCQMPRCTGGVQLNSGDDMSLACESLYSGNQQPSLQWFRAVHRRHHVFDGHPEHSGDGGENYGVKISSVDEFDLRESGPVARQVVRHHARHSDDGANYTCRMTLAGMDEQCNLVLNVTYLVRDLKFRPHGQTIRVGEELHCHARGNPTPKITLEPTSSAEKSGHGWKSFVVGSEWEGKDLEVRCTATNAVGDETETLTKSHTFHVEERRPDDHDHVQHNDHPPLHDSSSSSENHRPNQNPEDSKPAKSIDPNSAGTHQSTYFTLTLASIFFAVLILN